MSRPLTILKSDVLRSRSFLLLFYEQLTNFFFFVFLLRKTISFAFQSRSSSLRWRFETPKKGFDPMKCMSASSLASSSAMLLPSVLTYMPWNLHQEYSVFFVASCVMFIRHSQINLDSKL